jgi:hypothetical protein
MLNPFKCVVAEYISLIVKMHSNQDKSKYIHDNLELSWVCHVLCRCWRWFIPSLNMPNDEMCLSWTLWMQLISPRVNCFASILIHLLTLTIHCFV